MVKVALAGVSSGLGQTVLRVFLNTPHEHNIVVLSRGANAGLTAKGVDVRPVDYSDVAALTEALNGVHTLVSFLGGEGLVASQLSLLEAAKAAGVKRFAPSEFAGKSNTGIDLYAGKEHVWQEALKSGLEVTRFACGLFLNIMGTGTPKPPTAGSGLSTGEEEALGGLRPWNYVINTKSGNADFPGDGNEKFTLTETHDVGRFVLASLDLPSWPQLLGMEGDRVSFRELVQLAEKAQQRKFLVKETSVAELQEQIKRVPATTFLNQTKIALVEGQLTVPADLNKAFPAIKPTSAAEYIDKWWGNVTDLPGPQWEKNMVFDIANNKMVEV